MTNLTVKGIERAKPGKHADGHGLYLLVSLAGTKSWLLRVQVQGRRRDIGLGSLAELSLAEARDKARELRKIAKSGGDPIAARNSTKTATPTFAEAVNSCHKDGPPSRWQERYSKAFLASLKQHAFPKIGSLHVDSIDESRIVGVLAPLWHDRPAAARKLRQRIKVVLDFAKVRGWRPTGAPTISPRASFGKQPLPGNFAAMPYVEIPAFVADLRAKPVSVGRLALLFTVLTAARSGETRSARWSEIDTAKRTWTRPAKIMKSGIEHTVTLSPAALHVLSQAERFRSLSTDLIFPGGKGQRLTDMALLNIVKVLAGRFTVHGFRAAFRTWHAETMLRAFPEPVAEAALAHKVPDAVVRAYQRSEFVEMRRELLDVWGSYVFGRKDTLVVSHQADRTQQS